MASTRPLRFLAVAIFSTLATAASHALQLGETAAQITARHGAASVEDHGRQLAVYYWEGWSAQLEFKDGAVGRLTYRRNGYLAEAEIQSLLQANGGAARWRETTALGGQPRQWVRDDGAAAASDAARATGMIFQSAALAPQTATPAETILADSFLKFDAATSPTVAVQPAAAATNEPIVRSNAPPSRAESELSIPEPVAETPAPALKHAPTAIIESAAQPAASAAPAHVETRPASGENGRALFGLLFGGGAAVAALIIFRAQRKTAAPVQPVQPVQPAPAPTPIESDHADLDSLRTDQIELLLGEIFRRQGYTIELSAALGADGSSDLILRRDGESIPVQSRDWKTSRVGEPEVREFYSVMAATAAPRGVFATTGSFAREAREFAAAHAIELLDGPAFAQQIAAVRRPGENIFDVPSWIDDFTARARIFDPECPCCAQPMSLRQSRLDGSAHWACATYPRCSGRRETRRDLLTALAA